MLGTTIKFLTSSVIRQQKTILADYLYTLQITEVADLHQVNITDGLQNNIDTAIVTNYFILKGG